MGAIPAARLYHTKYRELPPPPRGQYLDIDIKLLYQSDKTLGLRGEFSFLTPYF